LEDSSRSLARNFKDPGDTVLLLGESDKALGGSEYMRTVHGTVAGALPRLDLKAERALYEVVLDLHAAGKLNSAHDVADGGLAVALAECCFDFESASAGGDFELGDPASVDDFHHVEPTRTDALLFSEGPSRMIVSTRDPQAVEARAAQARLPCRSLGLVGGSHLTLRSGGVQLTRHSVSELLNVWASLERSLSE
ncbi:MAG: AIR synthase-related protein, partial [Vicinamibacteria bacterium]